jgi:catechol 2,3-dioxygenase-like lactoylglutathione lyase family enzyme
MLKNYPIHPVLPVVDLNRARKFYEEVLGLKVDLVHESGVRYEAGNGTKLFIYPTEATKAVHTVAGFEVDDIETVMKNLRDRGVVFEEYDVPNLKTVDGIATLGTVKGAWFKDTEGNILALTQYFGFNTALIILIVMTNNISHNFIFLSKLS